ncbi:MAG: Glycosyl transferase [Candidatus Gottesmanbacteria bacterium GW2011_GWC2_39_8]|uniref:Glycosyl transferase n=1 Tax=Candidatus Gottesmanbacteria bacterium GW2011_GWC2_39_8 TaxID=1618450 RepID=A0A0G0PWY2_9BACT|nr:MAG: Glycosyl transferase [Candidatus Gottesmanbacteria bacterium GW2011_GWC2_39_8]
MKVYLSIIIPAYNAALTIEDLLGSIRKSRKVDLREVEVVVVDDRSIDNMEEVFYNSYKRYKNYKYYKLTKNSGPARARNEGVRQAKGEVVLFLDSDVKLFPHTLRELISSFKKDPDLFATTGVWDKKQKSKHFFPKFKALRDWSYWIHDRDQRGYYFLFSTRIAAIRKDLFVRLGGFNTSYKAALVEDIELTYRIARRYAVIFNPKLKVSHEFEDFLPIARKYFWRSFYWSRLYATRRKFDPVATTSQEAITTVSAVAVVGMGIISLSQISLIRQIGLIGIVGFFALHLFGVRKFLYYCLKEEGLGFAAKSLLVGFVLYLVIFAGAFYSLVSLKE